MEQEDDKPGETDEGRLNDAAAAKLLEAKTMFQREVLDEDASDRVNPSGNFGNVESGAEDFWKLYKNNTTCERPDSARGRYIANCQESSLLVLPVLDLKRPSRYERGTQVLRYDNYYFGDKRAEALGEALQLLPVPVQTLSMKNVGVSGSGSSAIMNGMPIRQLKHLDFSENRLGTKGALTIFRTLENPQVNLTTLDLGNNQLGDQAVRLLAQCLLNRCTLEHLDLRRNNIYHAAFSIGELLRISTPLTTLNLSWNNIRGEPAQHLARCMMENLTLTHLDLSDNTLGNNGNAAADLEEVYDCASMEPPQEFFEDKDGDGKIDVCGDICMTIGLKNLSDIEQNHVEQKVGKWTSFNVNNPTGRYQLNMANSVDRRILMRILEMNKMERKLRQQLKLIDTSQHGLAAQPLEGGFRNMRLNRLPMVMGTSWQFPRLGILEFDFVMARRPYTICTALNDGAFEQFLKEFKQLQVPAETKLIGLRSISTLYYFTCSQTQRLMEHFGTFERDSATGCLLRGEVFIVMFNRIIDEWNLSETLSLLDLTTKTQVLDRLGMLNCFHPLQQSEVYRQLQLNAFDQRQLILFLVKLAASGEAELTNVQLNGDTVEPEMWKTWTADDKLPTQGALGCSMRALQPVQSEAQLPPTSMRKKLMQTLLFKLPDKAQEQALS
ncbi:hypothetical protein BBJ29_005361 [Phytophthora kernoviae]|uniref:EF-hand domain-containing protein n=1 Tax=Phytophthora kernoviae TaxID=325452 RepID=A0A3F2RYK6_9STRA|nr:hypothetical protein BBJ29_005361 [Phytophthora kernoviae]RLN66818.1 hypothetical protein BBP00_00001973 [Phytophthora kernoviae]